MDIQQYQPVSSTELEELLREKYGGSNNFGYFLNDSKKAFDYCVSSKNISFHPIAGFENGKMRAHIALIKDARLPAGEAFFGFLESPNHPPSFRLLWNSLIMEARDKGISVLKGPVNGSIWHQYRCVKETDGSPFFKTELFCESYYYEYLRSVAPTSEMNYYSAYREPFDIVLQFTKDAYSKFAAPSFSIKEKRQATIEEWRTVAEISKNVFHTSWGYTELSEKEFVQLYSHDKLASHLNRLYLLYKGDDIIGFCGTLKENNLTLICKTICILPEYQGLGLGNALAYKVHSDARKDGFKKIIYALIRDGNSISNFPKDDIVIFRRYATFEFQI